MIRFAAVDAALEGFRLTRERPKAVGLWAVALFVANLAFLAMLVALGLGPALSAVDPLQAAPSPELLARGEEAGLWLPGVLALFIGVNAVLYTAVLRAVLEPADARFGYLRLGGQELRQVGLWLYAIAAFLGVQLMLLAVETAAAAAGARLEAQAGRFVMAGVAAAGFIAIFYPAVRLSIAPSMTFAERRIRLFSAWPLSRDQFWGMFGSYLVAALLALAVMLLATVVIAPLLSVLATVTGVGPALLLQKVARPDLASFPSVLAPETLLSLATNALLMALALAILAAPAPVIYLALKDAAPKP